jgi:hypothetical protein
MPMSPPLFNETHNAFMARCQRDGGDKVSCEQLWLDANGGLAPTKATSMNVPIPLRADKAAIEQRERRAWQHAVTASVFGANQRTHPSNILRSYWPNDVRAAMIVKAAVSPTTTAAFYPNDVVSAFKSIAPGSAAASLFAMANVLNMDGISTIRVPYVANLPPIAMFIEEGKPAPNQQFTLAASVLGPTKKMLLMAAVSAELEQAGPEAASMIIGRVLADRANRNLDLVIFGTGAGDAATPPGLLHGITPIAAAATGPDAMSSDLAALVAAIGAAGIDPTDAVFVASPHEAMLIATRIGFKFDNTVLASLGVPAKTVIAFAPDAVFSGYDGSPQIETSKESVIHFDDAPTDIGTAGGVAAPAKSMWQTETISVKVRLNCAWTALPGAVQVINTVAW